MTILAALVNAALLLVAVGAIAIEAAQRLHAGSSLAHGATLITVAGLGIIVNGATTLLFLRDRGRDLNIDAAFQHMAADTAVSLGVVAVGGLIMWTGKTWIDPLVSFSIACLIAWGSWRLLRSSTHLAIDGVPDTVDAAAVSAYLSRLPGVVEHHDMHIWSLSTTKVALTVHLVRPGSEADDAFIQSVAHDLERRFGIDHATIQLEQGNGMPCDSAIWKPPARYRCHIQYRMDQGGRDAGAGWQLPTRSAPLAYFTVKRAVTPWPSSVLPDNSTMAPFASGAASGPTR